MPANRSRWGRGVRSGEGPVRFSITARDGRERGRDVDVLLDADPDDALIEVLAPVVGALGDPMHPSFLAHLPVWVDGVPVEATHATVRAARLRSGSVLSVPAPASPPPDRPAGVAELRVVNGPGAGRVHRLPLGETLVGCGAAGLSLPDVRVPPNGLRVNGTIQGTVLVAPAPGFEVTLDGRPLEGETDWPEGAYLGAGETVLQRAPTATPEADVSLASDHAGIDFNRPPRLLPPERETRFTIPPEPRKPTKRAFPWIMVISPALMAAPMAIFFHSYY